MKKIKLYSVSYSYLKNLPDFHFQRLNNFLTSSHIYNFPFFNLFSAFETSWISLSYLVPDSHSLRKLSCEIQTSLYLGFPSWLHDFIWITFSAVLIWTFQSCLPHSLNVSQEQEPGFIFLCVMPLHSWFFFSLLEGYFYNIKTSSNRKII